MKTRTIQTKYNIHHPKAAKDRQCVNRKEGGKSLLEIEAMYEAKIINKVEYLKIKIRRRSRYKYV
jgi:hypothetical protein